MEITDYPIAKDISVVGNAFATGDNVGSALTASVNIGVSALGAFLDPIAWVVGQIMEPIYNWIIENVGFVKDTLNLMLGNPDEVAQTGKCTVAHADRVGERIHKFGNEADRIGEYWTALSAHAAALMLQGYARVQWLLVEILKKSGLAIEAVASIVDMVKQFIIGLGKELINELISKAVM